MAEKGNINEHFVSMNIHKIMYELNEVSNESTDIQEKIILQAIAYIENHFNTEINLTELAQYVNLTAFHFSRVFKKYTGYSPYEYVLNFRINHAKQLLQNTNLSIKKISLTSGFNSDTHFITTFKKHTNLTPKQFRELQFRNLTGLDAKNKSASALIIPDIVRFIDGKQRLFSLHANRKRSSIYGFFF